MPYKPAERTQQNKARTEAEAVLLDGDETGLSRWRQSLNFWVMVYRNFTRNRCPVRASALAYASLLALVPMLAVVLSVSSSLLKSQGEKQIEVFIEKIVAGVTPDADIAMEENDVEVLDPASAAMDKDDRSVRARREVARRIYEFVGNIRSGALGVTGMVVLLSVAISMLSRIEDTFNDIWGVTRGRSWFSRIVLYWAAVTLGPVLVIVTVGLTSGPHLDRVRVFISSLHWSAEAVVLLGMRCLPFFILSLGFGLFYHLMPNTKVHWRAALAGGVVGGCLWQLNNQFSVFYISRVVTNSKIYGSLGMVPVVMVGLYFSWIILLLGAQVAYAFQNRRSYLQEKLAEGIHERGREFAALRLMTYIGSRHQSGARPATGLELASALGIPSRLAGQILNLLVQTRLLLEVAGTETSYAPARPLDQITAFDVIDSIRSGRGAGLATIDDTERTVVRAEFERITRAERQQAESTTLLELVRRSNATC